MHVLWVKGLTGEEKKKRVEEVKSFSRGFKELLEILVEESSTPDYNCPSWAHKQADQNGYNRAIRHIQKLTES